MVPRVCPALGAGRLVEPAETNRSVPDLRGTLRTGASERDVLHLRSARGRCHAGAWEREHLRSAQGRSHAGAWERERGCEGVATRERGDESTARRRSHAGAWEREQTRVMNLWRKMASCATTPTIFGAVPHAVRRHLGSNCPSVCEPLSDLSRAEADRLEPPAQMPGGVTATGGRPSDAHQSKFLKRPNSRREVWGRKGGRGMARATLALSVPATHRRASQANQVGDASTRAVKLLTLTAVGVTIPTAQSDSCRTWVRVIVRLTGSMLDTSQSHDCVVVL